MTSHDNQPEPAQPRRIPLPLGVLILGGTFLLALGLVLGVVLEPYYMKSLYKVTGYESGAITYDQFKRLSPGMSERRVLAAVLEPYHKTAQGQWVYFRDDDYVIILWFVDRKIRRIQEVKILSSE